MNQEAFIKKISDKIHDLGLVIPAILLLETHKPLAFIGSQLLLIAQPALDIFWPHHLTSQSINLLADPAQLEQLITTLETNPTHQSSERQAKQIDHYPAYHELHPKEGKP